MPNRFIHKKVRPTIKMKKACLHFRFINLKFKWKVKIDFTFKVSIENLWAKTPEILSSHLMEARKNHFVGIYMDCFSENDLTLKKDRLQVNGKTIQFQNILVNLIIFPRDCLLIYFRYESGKRN